MRVGVVIPTVGRPSLQRLVDALAACTGPRPTSLVVVDDRPVPTADLVGFPGWTEDRGVVVRSGGRGPAGARNAGWHALDTEWVAFLDDDVVVGRDWLGALASDLDVARGAAASKGHVAVPLPEHRRPTDAERGTKGLETAAFVTADMAVRREALERVGGFDERFRRAYREDSDLALRLLAAGDRIAQGERTTTHPPRPEPWHASIGRQRGNADDVLARRLHGRAWRRRAEAPVGRLPAHAVIVGTTCAAAVLRSRRLALLAAAGVAELTVARVRPGSRRPQEVAAMAVTSAVLPFAAVAHRVRGELRWRTATPLVPAPAPFARPRAVLFDRDDTLVADGPIERRSFTPMQGAVEAVERVRTAGIAAGVVTNQPGNPDPTAGRDAVERLLGRFDTWQVCTHERDAGCDCRKPEPGLVLKAAADLGLEPADCVVVGDIGRDVVAAQRAGAGGVLVPTPRTLPDEVAAAPVVAASLEAAVRLLVGAR